MDSAGDLGAEWAAAREVLARLDENLHDLRKYGFSFITGLLTLDTLFTKGSDYAEGKLALIIGTMALIVILSLIDRNYRVMQTAAANRAKSLERLSNFELTWEITRVYRGRHVGWYYAVAYIGLALVASLVGVLILQDGHQSIIGAAAVLAALLIVLVELGLKSAPWMYLETNQFAYTRDELGLVVLTNFTGQTVKLKGIIWAVYTEEAWARYTAGGPLPKNLSTNPPLSEIELMDGQDYRWLLDFKELNDAKGLYRLVYLGPIYKKFLAWSILKEERNDFKGQKESAQPFVVKAKH